MTNNNNVTMKLNNELKGVELYFSSKPSTEIITKLKTNSFRWNGSKMCWYAKQSENTLQFANTLTNNNNIITDQVTEVKTETTIKAAIAEIKKSLFERVQFSQVSNNNHDYGYKFVGVNYDSKLETKEIASLIRKELKTRFQEIKFSVKSTYNTINIYIVSSPYNYSTLDYNFNQSDEARKEVKDKNKELLSILDYCTKLLNSYNFDDSDSQSDYFHTNYYGYAEIAYDYIQTEQNEQVKNDIENFRNCLEIEKQKEEIKRHEEYQAYLIEQELKNAQYKLRQEQVNIQEQEIENHVSIIDVTEQEQYMINNILMANCNKENTLAQYQEQINANEYYLNNAKITRELHFSDPQILENFSNLFLHDFTFLTNQGGSYTDDIRINSMTDYNNMTKEERNTVTFNLFGVAVYLNNKLQFIVDPQGFSYSRYVGLINQDTTIDKSKIIEQVTDEETEMLILQAEILEE
jgi:hypothetical protein